MREEEKVMRFLTVLVGSMMTISVFITFFVVSNLTPSFLVWIAIWFIILWRYPEARWWGRTGRKIEKLHWFSLMVTGIAILCLQYVIFLLVVDFVFPFFQEILDFLLEMLSRAQGPW